MANVSIESLKRIGGAEWKVEGKHRIYFNDLADLYGLKLRHFNTGNISDAWLDGDKISNCRAREIVGVLAMSKVYYDVIDGSFHAKMGGYSRRYNRETLGECIISELERRVAAFDATGTTEVLGNATDN